MEPVARYLLRIAYHGGRYSGWQRNPGTKTIAGALEEAATQFIGHGSLGEAGIVGSFVGVVLLQLVQVFFVSFNFISFSWVICICIADHS